jgi:Fe-S-cluster containining protein
VDLNLASALTAVKVAVKEAADKASLRRLQLYDDVKCKPGCSACCNRQIYITTAEALIIQEHLEKTDQWADVEKRARALLKLARDTTPVAWFKMNIMCPVLDPVTRLCTAYESRPTPCSTHFVRSDPSQCDPWSMKPGKYDPVDFPELHENFMKALAKIVDGYGILALRFPIPIALIFAARIKMQSGLRASEVISLIYNELA